MRRSSFSFSTTSSSSKKRSKTRMSDNHIDPSSASDSEEDSPTTKAKKGVTLGSLFRRFSFSDAQRNVVSVEINEEENHISALPAELLLAIFGFLRCKELVQVALVCKEFNAVSKDDFLWRKIFRDKWKKNGDPTREGSWKALVKKRVAIADRWKQGKTKSVVQLTSAETNRVWSVQLDEEKIVSGSTSAYLQVWNLKGDLESNPPQNLKGHTAEVRCHQFIDNHLVSGGYDTTVRIWNLKEGQCLRVLPHKADVYGLQFDKEKIVSCTRDSLVRLWDFETGDSVGDLKGHTLCLRTVTFDHNFIMSAGEDKTAKVWDARTRDCVATLEGHKNGLTSLQFDDDKIATGSFDASVKLWDFRTFKCYLTLQPKKLSSSHPSRFYYHSPLSVWQLQFDEDKLATAHADHCIKIWDMKNGAELASLKGHTGEVIALHFDENRLVSGSEDRSLRVWDFSSKP